MCRFMLGVFLGLLLQLSTASACTDFMLKAQDGSVMVARTMEFAVALKSNLRTSLRGRQFNETAANGKPGLSWRSQYGYVFLDGLNQDFAVDGMNEKGLAIESLYLPAETQYQLVPEDQEAHALPYFRFGDWVLSNFKTVDEVQKALPSIYVFTQTLPGMGNMIFPLHYAIYDATGKGIIVEFVQGRLHIYNNEAGVLTNSPTYNWQIVNLRNYLNLSPFVPQPITIGGLIFAATGAGSGMKGLPGDVSPPSRFVKVATYKASSIPARNAKEALTLAQHIMNNVDIPAGTVRANDNGRTVYETTQWTIFKDLTNRIFYYHTYGDTTLHSVALSQLDFTENASRLKMPIEDEQYVVDMTKAFRQTIMAQMGT